MTSGVPAQGPDLDELEAAMNGGGQPHAYDVLALVAAVRELTGERDRARDLAAHLEAELARATGEVSRLSEGLSREKKIAAAYKGWRGHEVVEAKTNLTTLVNVANIERDHALRDLAAEQEKREALEARIAAALAEMERINPYPARNIDMFRTVRAALSGDTGGES